jgi:hypothetical protein
MPPELTRRRIEAQNKQTVSDRQKLARSKAKVTPTAPPHCTCRRWRPHCPPRRRRRPRCPRRRPPPPPPAGYCHSIAAAETLMLWYLGSG